ncbi:MAG: hypothetical protein JOZ86_06285 [Candidatus Eremiobacteraeota bacterium]|nr:hypothetical protein [Candidatus Eremiobacteraeota bacterium]
MIAPLLVAAGIVLAGQLPTVSTASAGIRVGEVVVFAARQSLPERAAYRAVGALDGLAGWSVSRRVVKDLGATYQQPYETCDELGTPYVASVEISETQVVSQAPTHRFRPMATVVIFDCQQRRTIANVVRRGVAEGDDDRERAFDEVAYGAVREASKEVAQALRP